MLSQNARGGGECAKNRLTHNSPTRFVGGSNTIPVRDTGSPPTTHNNHKVFSFRIMLRI